MNREDLIETHTTETAKCLFGIHTNLFLICDGTYTHHKFQKKSFSGQNKVLRCNPFTICTTDGFVVDMLGQYPANFNDAKILKTLLQNPDT